jgi:hypothetical protein
VIAAAGGLVHESVSFTNNDAAGGRGLVAARNIARGEQLIVVPGPLTLPMIVLFIVLSRNKPRN